MKIQVKNIGLLVLLGVAIAGLILLANAEIPLVNLWGIACLA